jgi:hypothetical protein
MGLQAFLPLYHKKIFCPQEIKKIHGFLSAGRRKAELSFSGEATGDIRAVKCHIPP